MLIGAVADPLEWDRWPEVESLLEPARARGDFPSVLEPNEALFVVMDGDELLACATAWLSVDGYVEVKLVGGRDYRRWLSELDKVIGAAALEAGATRMIAIGRRGWLKSLERLGWAQCQPVEDHWLFERKLERGQPVGQV
jgi:hypothetical protein